MTMKLMILQLFPFGALVSVVVDYCPGQIYSSKIAFCDLLHFKCGLCLGCCYLICIYLTITLLFCIDISIAEMAFITTKLLWSNMIFFMKCNDAL